MINSTKFIFVTGGVVSSLGKGIAVASLAALLQSRGYKVKMRKLDPYLNIDPGTMSPYQHGEVFVTEDGAETDLDLGHYERFTGINAEREDSITTGQIYSELLKKERKGEYLGGTVQVIPHVTNLIKNFIKRNLIGVDFLLCEIGGTVGDIEGLPYFEAIRQLGYEMGQENVVYIHLTLVPYIASARELKTKPSQHSVKELRSIGIQPNIILCRADRDIPEAELQKIGLFCNVPQERVIPAIDCDNVYKIPLAYHKNGLDKEVLKFFKLPYDKESCLSKWYEVAERIDNYRSEVKIAIVGKYSELKDAYKSIIEAFDHSGINNDCKVVIDWIKAEELEHISDIASIFKDIQGVMIPGGFGNRGVLGKIKAIQYARENNIPFFGICLGMQLAIIEYARNVIGIQDADSTEFNLNCTPVIALVSEWLQGEDIHKRSTESDLGGTMRLGSYPCKLSTNSLAYKAYEAGAMIFERHRHRYEFNLKFLNLFKEHGMAFSGLSPSEELVEVIELPNHQWFLAVQFHPELKSRLFNPHPLFESFVKNAIKYKKLIISIQ